MTSTPDEPRTDRLPLRRVGPGAVRAAITARSAPGANRFRRAVPPSAERAAKSPGTGEVIGSGGPRHHGWDGERTSDPFRCRGPVPAMARAAIARAHRDRPAVTVTDHEPSQRVAEKLGFAHAGSGPVPVGRRQEAAMVA